MNLISSPKNRSSVGFHQSPFSVWFISSTRLIIDAVIRQLVKEAVWEHGLVHDVNLQGCLRLISLFVDGKLLSFIP